MEDEQNICQGIAKSCSHITQFPNSEHKSLVQNVNQSEKISLLIHAFVIMMKDQ